MPFCAAIGCSNKSYRKTKLQNNLEQSRKITFHRFPKDEKRKLIWIKTMGLREERLPKTPHLCSLHFLENDFDRTSLMLARLKENSIPISNTSEIEFSYKEIENPSTDGCTDTLNVSDNSSLTVQENNLTVLQDIIKIELPEISCHDFMSPIALTNSDLPISHELPLEFETTERHSLKHDREEINDSDDDEFRSIGYFQTFDVPTNQQLEDTPSQDNLRKALAHQKAYYQRQLRALKQRNKRQEKRIATLTTLLKNLKQKVV